MLIAIKKFFLTILPFLVIIVSIISVILSVLLIAYCVSAIVSVLSNPESIGNYAGRIFKGIKEAQITN